MRWAKQFFTLLTILLISWTTTGFALPDSVIRRIQDHLIIGDSESALHEAEEGINKFPESKAAHEWFIKSLAAHGEERAMMEAWEKAHSVFPEVALKKELLEDMCWGILKKGQRAHGGTTRLISVVGAALTQDAHAVPTLLSGLRDSNARIRLISVELAALYGDTSLKKQLILQLHTEKNPDVYLQIVKAFGTLKMKEMIPELMHIIEGKQATSEEKKMAILSIAKCRESVNLDEIRTLARSRKAHLRMLACECMARFCQSEETIALLPTLIQDANPEVRASALKTVGLLHLVNQEVLQAVEKAACAQDPHVGITAGWVLLLLDQSKGKQCLGEWLKHESADVRALAAAAVGAAGSYGTAFALEVIDTVDDPYVKLNLACALIGQRTACDKACHIVENFLQTHKEHLMAEKSENSLFQPIIKSTLTHHPGIPNYPEVMNQTVRLQLLNLLAILNYPGVQEIVKDFLKEKNWKVTGLAAELLLEEGDETALEQVRELLEDKDFGIRTEAALCLAMWGKEKTALPILLQAYSTADRQLKIKILEALGRIGDRTTIPFLIQRLKEPSSTLRLIAACVLIQTLNH